ncbi:MAG: TonB-dependent siderophore receptor, partial [Noviherbaspirillum sp.]
MHFRLSILASALPLALAAHYAQAQAQAAQELPAVTVTSSSIGFKSNVVQVGTFRDMAPLDVPQTSNVVTREVLD